MADDPIVLVEELVKVYPGGTRAVDGIDFSVAEGEFFGFLGPNGAGKSTTMKVLSTLLRKTSGRVRVAGFEVDSDSGEVRKRIGFAMQEVGVDDLSTGWDFLVLQGVLYGQSPRSSRARAGELLELVGLTSVADRRIATYSGGMRRRIDLVGALMHRPQVLFLDEPTTGLDPQSRLAIWEYLGELNRSGVTIFLTTQMMEEADRLCERIAIIDVGKIVAEGTSQALKDEIGGELVRVALEGTEQDGRLAAAEELVRRQAYASEVTAAGKTLTVTVRDGSAAAPKILTLLHDAGFTATDLSVASPSLDDVFLRHTGRSIRDEEATGSGSDRAWAPWLGLSSRR